ncbi:hypothetical protein FB567DRAFT_188135 [Paraphoma chrysanthemicola]|uniref:Rhodopsin domain-containing protein n=1 Tax=Paraphoma chrysanthemicola TaxID=798071 RepID=A0A8K0QVK3_9PLEO|nr:hypothetical protein FB567DRAFT_188135 [Paraphoma chrysanthemicola]
MTYKPDAGVMSSMIITFSAATIILVCRLVSRRITRATLWLDDYFAVISWLAAALYFGFTIYWATVMGLGHVKEDIPKPAEKVDEYARFGLFMAEFLYAMSLGFSKLAILCFYWRLFSVSVIRPGIYILQASTIIWLTIRTFMTIFHCLPVQAYWNLNIKGAVCRIDPGKFMFGTTLVHLFLEIAVLLLPVFQVASLKLRLSQKIAVVAMFMFGIFVCAASIVVLVKAIKFNSKTTEMARDIKGVIIWAGTEADLAIISSCLPITKPIFRRFLSGSTLGTKSTSTGPNALSYLTSSKGIKLRTTSRTKDLDDNSSERQFAQTEDGSSGKTYFETYAERGGHNNTTISCDVKGNDSNDDNSRTYGIQVKNETDVRYESI